MTLVAFCGCEMKAIYDNVPVSEVKTLTDKDYSPCCMTPLYDAVGTTITRVHALKSREENALAIVTIITDGYENASHEFTLTAIRSLIESYKEQGWQFTYIGADHDVEQVAFTLHIDHSLKFEKTSAGTKAMFAKERKARGKWLDKVERLKQEYGDEALSSPHMKNLNAEEYFE